MKNALTFDDVLLVPQFSTISSRKDVNITMTDKKGILTLDLPIFSANMDTITESSMASFMRSSGGMGVLHRFMSIERNVEEFKKFPYCFVSVGVHDKHRLHALFDAGANWFCVDVAHGHSLAAGEMVSYIRKTYPKSIIIAGNVCTAEGTTYLINSGADLVKVGIGPGSVCTTRIKTGFGHPQLDAIKYCAEAASNLGVSIIADGGLRTPGDIVKALAFGADFVMIGNLLSGTEPTPGEVKYFDRPLGQYRTKHEYEKWPSNQIYYDVVKEYRGMASKEAADDHLGGLTEWKTAEGVSTEVPVKDIKSVISDIIGGLRSGLSYAGAYNIQQLQNNLEYVTITENGRIEGKAHKLL